VRPSRPRRPASGATATLPALVTGQQRIHLVRHGEVDNPTHVVYASLEGFGLSELGRSQAEQAADWLAARPVARVVSSPLQRADETAAPIARRHGLRVDVDERLTEWQLASLWAGVPWEDLARLRPGQIEAYISNPDDLPFSPEPLWRLALRVAAVVFDALSSEGDVVLVSHQDPVEAARRTLTGRAFDDFHAKKPRHAAVTTVDAAGPLPWPETSYWEPEQGEPFPPRS